MLLPGLYACLTVTTDSHLPQSWPSALLTYQVAAVQREMEVVQGNSPSMEQNGEGSVGAQADEAWAAAGSRNNSVIQDLFLGQCQSTLQCHHCGAVSLMRENVMDLSLPLPEKFNQGSTCTIQVKNASLLEV